MPVSSTIDVLMVCTGNICRSPLAADVFLHLAQCRGVAERFAVDSAGTGDWHVGEPPDSRISRIAARQGIILSGRARQVSPADLRRFDHLICMDESHREELIRLGAPQHKLRLLLEGDPSTSIRDVPDPYYGGADGFETVYRLIDSACEALLDDLLTVVP